jgi:hypothetical protein
VGLWQGRDEIAMEAKPHVSVAFSFSTLSVSLARSSFLSVSSPIFPSPLSLPLLFFLFLLGAYMGDISPFGNHILHPGERDPAVQARRAGCVPIWRRQPPFLIVSLALLLRRFVKSSRLPSVHVVPGLFSMPVGEVTHIHELHIET